MLYSLAGSALSLSVMLLLRLPGKFSVPAVSIAGAVAHNAGQLILAWVMLGRAVLYYFPVLEISGVITGILTGFIAALALRDINYRNRQ